MRECCWGAISAKLAGISGVGFGCSARIAASSTVSWWSSQRPSAVRACSHWAVAWPRVSLVILTAYADGGDRGSLRSARPNEIRL